MDTLLYFLVGSNLGILAMFLHQQFKSDAKKKSRKPSPPRNRRKRTTA